MATFVDDVLNPSWLRQRTRAERIEDARRGLAEEKSKKRPYRYSIKHYRHTLTREALYQRVEQGEPVARLRWQWIQLVEAHRHKLYGALGLRYHVGRLVAYLDADRERLTAGTITKGRNKGQPYSAVTLHALRLSVARRERELAEAEPQIGAFLASAPLPYHVWRRQQAPTGSARRGKGPSRVKASDNVIDFTEARRRAKGENA